MRQYIITVDIDAEADRFETNILAEYSYSATVKDGTGKEVANTETRDAFVLRKIRDKLRLSDVAQQMAKAKRVAVDAVTPIGMTVTKKSS